MGLLETGSLLFIHPRATDQLATLVQDAGVTISRTCIVVSTQWCSTVSGDIAYSSEAEPCLQRGLGGLELRQPGLQHLKLGTPLPRKLCLAARFLCSAPGRSQLRCQLLTPASKPRI